MPVFTKSSLHYTYKWPKESFSEPTSLDGDVIELDNGYHVLNFINVFFEKKGLTSMITFVRLEFMLHEKIPRTLKARKEITSWILKHWNREFYG
ncbi:hypothetical protein FMM05_19330 [Flavobacterium zepuense]|uniref:Uncharacterized protein n=1 Tax=Flavobacterium zepuense TaxID=2593302 RepID=A0A552UUL8_9FLAO|nr:hypothetical protein [Flavobacterium zepuense]TRW21943.1 hypothetical protein FMM05_19330 [Flavobacterium zepuense]